jgi:hypothetical protein
MSFAASHSLIRRHALGVVLFVAAASTGLAACIDGDIWWHLAAGREMVARRELLFTDPFSVSAAGRAWIDVHWLFQLSIYALHRAFGLAGLVWVKSAVIGLGAVLLLAAVGRRRESLWTRPLLATLLAAGLLLARSLLLPRPVIVTLLMLAAFFYLLERFGREGRPALLWGLPALQVVWANCQGLSALGPAMVLAYVLAAAATTASLGRRLFAREASSSADGPQRVRQLALALLATCIATAVTPFGLRGLTLPFTLFSRLLPGEQNLFAHAIAENVSPFALERATGGEFWHLKGCLGLLALAMLAAGRRLRLSHVLLLLGFVGLALMSNRNVLLLYWIAAPIAALQLGPFVRRKAHAWRNAGGKPLAIASNAAALLGLLCVSGVAAAREPSLAEPAPFRMPLESASLLSNLPHGDVFTADHQGGYLSFRLHPRFRPYLDTRHVLRSAQELGEYLDLVQYPERFDALQDRRRFAYVVLPTAYPDRYLGLIRHLHASPSWRLIHTDGAEVLFARADIAQSERILLSDAATIDRMVARARQRYQQSAKLLAASQLQLATLVAAVGELAQVETALAELHTPEADALRARTRLASGDLESAERVTARLLERDHDDVRSLNLMALISMRRGQPVLVGRYLRRALSVAPFDAEANLLLANLEETER